MILILPIDETGENPRTDFVAPIRHPIGVLFKVNHA